MKTSTSLAIVSALLISSVTHGQYCMLPGRTPYSNIQPGISNFKLNTINRTSAPVESFSTVVVETGDTTTLLRGHTYTLIMTHTRDSVVFPTVRNNIRVWIDYNHNGSYDDAGETVISSDYQTYGVFTDTFTVPMTAATGYTMLRATAKMSSDGGHTIPTSCDSPADPIGYHGEMEDYVVRIQAPSAIANTGTNFVHAAIFPNPTSDQIIVSLDEMSNGPISVTLYDITGKLLGTLMHETMQSATVYHFDLNRYTTAPGVYMLRIDANGVTSYNKILKNQ